MRTTALIIVLGMVPSTPAIAHMYDLYRADYVKGSYCSVIGGACAADLDFDSSFFQNPASLTAARVSDYDWDYDYDLIQGKNLEPGLKKNNDVQQETFLAAFSYRQRNWGFGLSFTQQVDKIGAVASFYDDAAGAPVNFRVNTTASTTMVNIPISYRFSDRFSLGVTLVSLFQRSKVGVSGNNASSSTNSQNLPAVGAAIGGIWQMSPYFRTGGWVRSPITYYYSQQISTSSAFTKFSFNEDIGINYPSMWAVGAAWNPWKDKRTFSFDLNVVGTTTNGYLLSYDNFATAQAVSRIEQKGRKEVVDPRIGYRGPWWTGSRGTLSLGAYYENSRWAGYPGILHATAGLAYNMPWFKFLIFDGIELMAGLDISKDYQVLFFTYR